MIKKLAFPLVMAAAALPAAAVTPIPLTWYSPTEANGSFSGLAAVDVYSLNLTGLGGPVDVDIQVSSSVSKGGGYDIFNVTFDGIPFSPLLNFSFGNPATGSDYWTFTASGITPAVHLITVTGTALRGSLAGFVGTIGVTSLVPEPESYALFAAGLAVAGWLLRRRQPGA